jgi:hypothetical protein
LVEIVCKVVQCRSHRLVVILGSYDTETRRGETQLKSGAKRDGNNLHPGEKRQAR